MRPRLLLLTTTLAALVVVGGGTMLGRSNQSTAAVAAQPAPRPPAASLSRPGSASKAPDPAGFIRRWLVLEPVGVPPQLGESAVQALVKDARFNEQRAAPPADRQQVTVGDQRVTWHAFDTLAYNVTLFHFAYALNKPTSNVLFWAATIVEAPRDIPGVRLAIGSNAASVWWLNGEEVIGLYNDRQAVIDDGVSKRVTLKKGPNIILAAIVNGGGATDFCARFIDEQGNPVKGFVTRTTAESTAR